MKNTIILLICLLTLTSRGQDLEATWSQFTEVSRTDIAKIVGVTEERIVVAVKGANDKNKATLIEYGREFGSYSTLEAKFKGEQIIHVAVLDGHTTVFSSRKLENKTKELYVRTIHDGEFSEPTRICTSGFAGSRFDFSISPNGEYLGIIANAPYRKGKNEEIETWIFDKTLKQALAYNLALTNDNLKVKINVPVMSNTGVFFIIKRYRVGLDNNYYVFAIDPETQKHLKKTLTLMGKRVADVKYELDAENNLHLAGFYVSQSYNIYEGSFYFKLDQTAKAISFKQNPFSEEFLIEAEGKKAFKKFGGLVDFKINHMKKVNGKIYLTAAHSKREKVDTGTEVKTLYGKEKMALVCLKSDGSEEFIKILNLDQHSNNDKGFWNHHALMVNEKTVLVAHNLKDENRVTLKLSSLNEGTFKTNDASHLYSGLSGPVGLNLRDTHALQQEVVVTAWNLERNKFSVGIIRKKDF